MSKTALLSDAAGALHQLDYEQAAALFARDASYAAKLRAAGFVSVALVHDFENVPLDDPSFLSPAARAHATECRRQARTAAQIAATERLLKQHKRRRSA